MSLCLQSHSSHGYAAQPCYLGPPTAQTPPCADRACPGNAPANALQPRYAQVFDPVVPAAEIEKLGARAVTFDDLLKNADVAAALSTRGVNISLALTAAYGLRAYLHGDKATAIEDLATAAEEIATRAGTSKA